MHVALLTGRAGSTIHDKNFRVVHGRPMCAYPCAAANMAGVFDRTYCSSNDDRILKIASAYGFKSILRPDHLATATAKHRDVINHFLEIMRGSGCVPTRITVLMANSATIISDDLVKASELLDCDLDATSAVPVVVEQDHHPYRAKKLVDGKLESYFDFENNISTNRQELPLNYFLTHSFWTIRLRDNGSLPDSPKSQPWTFLGERCLPVVVEKSIDIHSESDFDQTFEWLEANQKMVF